MDGINRDLDSFRNQWRQEPLGSKQPQDLHQSRESSAATTSTIRELTWEPSATESSQRISATPGPSQSLFYVDGNMEVEPNSLGQSEDSQVAFTIATDFGTTFSCLMYSKRENGIQGPITVIQNYPEDVMPFGKLSREVPTETWYPNAAITRNETPNGDFIDDEEAFEDIFAEAAPVLHSGENDDLISDRINSIEDNGEQMEVENNEAALLWGFQTQNEMRLSSTDDAQFSRMARFKLLLDTSDKTEKIRNDLKPAIRRLKRRKIIQHDADLISDYLTVLFRHAKNYLVEIHGLSPSCSIEHVLCVPNIWSSKACRTMQKCMETAIQANRFGSLDNLFIVSESEAAAAHVLEDSDEINPGETFLIVDAGGGTCDTTTYTVTKKFPLRLNREAVEPGGDLFGSSYLNDSFRDYMRGRLEDEEYLETGGYTIKGIVDALVLRFENQTKRRLDVTTQVPHGGIAVQGLRKNVQKRFSDNSIDMHHNDWVKIYRSTLTGVSELMINQLDLAIGAGLQVQKVILVGGFSGSPSLREFLKRRLKEYSARIEYPIQLIGSKVDETAVAQGAVRRALNKEDGPLRKTLSSYGFQIHEPYDPDGYPAHKEVRPTIDKLDGVRYVRDTIRWLVKRGDELPARREYSIEVEHTFASTNTILLCGDYLFVSDKSTESHYRKTHPKNKGAEIAGSIEADMTFLKTNNLISVETPDRARGEGGRPHYRVNYELVMIVEGRNLRYEARYPAGGQVQDQGQISIAAAFVPGTN